jgi:uncharacterized phage-associated protein
MGADLKFPFSLDKLIHSIAFFSVKGVRDLSKLKVAKLLYFADKDHLLAYGRPIIGDMYFCLPYGPVPSVSLNEMSDALNTNSLERSDEIQADSVCFAAVLGVRKPLFGGHPVFRAKKSFDSGVFSKSELQSLDKVVALYGQKSAGELVDLSHRELTWEIPNKLRSPRGRVAIPYELFFEGAPEEAKAVLRFLKEEQREQQELESFMKDISSVEDTDLDANSTGSRRAFSSAL